MNNDTSRIFGYIAFCAVLMAARPATAQQGVHADPLLPIDQTVAYQQARVKDVMHVLAVAIKEKDFTGFRASSDIAAEFRAQFSNAQLRQAFNDLIASGVDLTHLDAMAPVIDGAQETLFSGIDLKGHYPSVPVTKFDFIFVRQGADLVASEVKVHVGRDDAKPAATPAAAPTAAAPVVQQSATTASTMPSAQPPQAMAGATMSVADQTTLATEAMHQFIAAVRAKDKNVFLSSPLVSRHWQENQFSRQFDANFDDAMATDSDIASLDGRTPRIEEGNTRVDPEGRTHFLAFYSGRKQHLLQLSCVNENGAWRLVKFAL